MADQKERKATAFNRVLKTFKIESLKESQVEALENGRSIALIISPLTSLMQDQVRYLKSVGISAEFIGDDQMSENANEVVERGECQIVYGSPEAFLSTKTWRAMISNNVYKERLRLVAVDEAHCISHW
ncbi:mediator of RNA polymerase II transcription subunit 34-like [Paramuricea clavata]|uniref:Mediator of RNA polymerase II transcription subunit 34-like n=1 Tax=Paramuricea clavata TaxID=317549 RepID=A0A6S7JUT2_PARCT|nr:mediator of RNA polymerase II transcription subunit 34-like [Paramuricea clavata]